MNDNNYNSILTLKNDEKEASVTKSDGCVINFKIMENIENK